MALIAAHHSPVSDQSLGRNLLVTQFLRCIRRLRPPVHSRMPIWDLAVVLEALSKAPFEPLEEVPLRFLTVKTVFLLATSSLKRVGDCRPCQCHVLSLYLVWREHFCTPGWDMSPWCPQLFHGQSFFRHSVHLPFGMLTRKSLIVCIQCEHWTHTFTELPCGGNWTNFLCGPYKKALPANKQTLSRWIVDAITTAYESSDFPSPLGDMVHSTRGMAASKAFSSGLSMHNICNAVGWSTPLTYVRFYSLDLEIFSSFCRSTLGSDLSVWWHEPDSYWCAEDGFNDGRVERFQQLLWQAALPQLAKEVQPLLGLFYNGVFMIVPLQVLGDGGAQEPEWIHCSHSAVHDGKWGESRGVSPEVHDHLHCFEHVILQVVKTATDSQLLNLRSVSRSWMRPISVVSSANFGSLTKGSLDVQSFVFREKRSGERTQSWGAPVLIVWVLDENFPSLTSSACLSVWSTDRRRWGRRAVSVLAGGGLGW